MGEAWKNHGTKGKLMTTGGDGGVIPLEEVKRSIKAMEARF